MQRVEATGDGGGDERLAVLTQQTDLMIDLVRNDLGLGSHAIQLIEKPSLLMRGRDRNLDVTDSIDVDVQLRVERRTTGQLLAERANELEEVLGREM
jgi:hypothetical protein